MGYSNSKVLQHGGWKKTAAVAALAASAGILILLSRDLTIKTSLIAALGLIYVYLLKNFEFWQANLIVLIGGYFILTRGFAYLGLRLGSLYVFIGEIAILTVMMAHNFGAAIRSFLKTPISRWLAGWVILGTALFITNILTYDPLGVVRDFAIVYYSIFILFGYAFYKNDRNLDTLFRILGWIFLAHTLWGMSYPWRDVAERYSPKLFGITALFSFRNDADTVSFTAGILYFVVMARRYGWPWAVNIALIITQLILIFVFQVRAAYVGFALTVLFLSMIHRKRDILKIAAFLMAIFAVAFALNLSLQGRRGDYDIVSAENTLKEVVSIFQYEKSGTATLRVLWWKAIVGETLRNARYFLFGKGFGPSLAVASYLEVGDYARRDEEIGGLAKSPHSAIITIFGRMGIAGLILWVGFNAVFFLRALKGLRIAKAVGDESAYNILSWIMAYALMCITTATFGVLIEGPFAAIPYQFFMGLGTAISERLIRGHRPVAASGSDERF
jgi:hypothetical protein